MKIAKGMKRNPQAPHVQAYSLWRQKKGKPKAVLDSSRGQPLTWLRYNDLMANYEGWAERHLLPQQSRARLSTAIASKFIERLKSNEEREELVRRVKKSEMVQNATLQSSFTGYKFANEIIKDFGHTKGLRAFGFGVGYGQLLFFLKNFMKAKVAGVDLGEYSKDLTKFKKLRVKHGVSASDESLKRLGKFDITYSSNFFGDDFVNNKKDALAILDNMSHLTKKGGKSYHYIGAAGEVPVTRQEVEATGFRIDKWDRGREGALFLKLTKIRE